ncbi:hypothetical protein [Bacillus solitudinis]|uniref:hypothetical protein n=1 Tax=Bacillus solitudinis TaxID=2014074 RepID=UPI000C23A8B7|nr:hypothetical protein [Bacillus solitudinis]
MTEWLKKNQKTVFYALIILFLVLIACYVYLVRPVAIEKEEKELLLSGVNNEITTLETTLASLVPDTLSEGEKQQLTESVSIKPEVEQMIAELEKTEIDAEVVIENISVSVLPNVNEQEKWRHIFSEELYEPLQEKVVEVEDLTVSYVEMVINVSGLIDNVHWFVREVENLQKTVHVQSYTFGLDSENRERANAILTLRTFYSSEFAPFIEYQEDFELDYEFDSGKIKRYVTETTNITVEDYETIQPIPIEPPFLAPIAPSPTSPSSGDSFVRESPKYEVYQRPLHYEATVTEGDSFIYFVQSGGYSLEEYLYLEVQNLVNKGFYPRIEGSKTNFIYTSIGSDEASAVRKASYIRDQGFPTFVKAIPIRLSEAEQTILNEAYEVMANITEITTKGLTAPEYTLTPQRLQAASNTLTNYQTKVQSVIDKSSGNRKIDLEETARLLKQVENTLNYYHATGNTSVLWQTEGLMLDFALTLNGFERISSK